MSKKTHGSVHHIKPISRGGKKVPENEVKVNPSALHESWHTLFGNDTVEEVIAKIKYVWSDSRGIIREEYLVGERIMKRGKKIDKRMSAWKTIFGDTRFAKEAIEIIKETFVKEVFGR